MATENKIIKNRIDTLANWTSNNPLIQPGETCYIQGSTEYRVNVSNAATNFLNCQLFKGTDTTASAPGNGTTTLQSYQGTRIGTWTANQSTANTVTLPNFVANAKIEFPSTKVNALLDNDWTPEKQLTTEIPNCIPTDFIMVVFREVANQLNLDLEKVKEGINKALTLCNIKSA